MMNVEGELQRQNKKIRNTIMIVLDLFKVMLVTSAWDKYKNESKLSFVTLILNTRSSNLF